MNKFLIFLCIFLMSIDVFSINKQQDNISKIITRIENSIIAKNQDESLGLIDSLLTNNSNLSEKVINTIKSLKVEALTETNLLEESLLLSKELENENLTIKQKISILVNNELAYEIIGNFEKAKEKIELAKKLYEESNVIKDRLYGKFLFRYSSFFRVQGLNSKALPLAEKAFQYGKANNYPDVQATASILLGYLAFDNDLEASISHFKNSAPLWKKVNDKASLASYYYIMSQFSNMKKDNQLREIYLDSAISTLSNTKHYNELGIAYDLKKRYFDQKNNLDSVIKYQEKSQKAFTQSNLNNQNIKIRDIETNYEIKKQKTEKEQAIKDLKAERKQSLILLIGIISLLATLSIIILFYIKNVNKNKKIKQQKEQISKSLEEKSILLRELHHRVKNNLSMMISLVDIQSEKSKTHSDKQLFKDLENRIQTVAVTHNQFLYTNDNQFFSITVYLSSIINMLTNLHPKPINKSVKINDFLINLDTALPIGMIVNELITNSLKYAKPKKELNIYLTISKLEEIIYLEYKDNGIYNEALLQDESVGLFLIKTMTKQLQGTYNNYRFNFKFELRIK